MPKWAKAAYKRLIDLEMNKKELAKALEINYAQLCNVMSGYVNNQKVAQKIRDYLKISEGEEFLCP
jgi:hypothetical protein